MEIRIPISATQVACFIAGLCLGVNAHAAPVKQHPIHDLSSMLKGSTDPCLANIEKRTTQNYLMLEALYQHTFKAYLHPRIDGSTPPPLY